MDISNEYVEVGIMKMHVVVYANNWLSQVTFS